VQNISLNLWTQWQWGIVRFHKGSHTKDKVQSMTSSDIIMSATICSLLSVTCRLLNMTWCRPDTMCQMAPVYYVQVRSACNLPCFWIWIHRSISESILSSQIWKCHAWWEYTSECGAKYSGVVKYNSEHTWDHPLKCVWVWLQTFARSIQQSRLSVYHQVQFEASCRAYLGL